MIPPSFYNVIEKVSPHPPPLPTIRHKRVGKEHYVKLSTLPHQPYTPVLCYSYENHHNKEVSGFAYNHRNMLHKLLQLSFDVALSQIHGGYHRKKAVI